MSAGSYDRFYRDFDSPLMQQIRREAYGHDIGQHSWVTKHDLETDIAQLQLTSASRVLDLGCGPGGALAFIVGLAGCNGTGIDVSAPAITVARRRCSALGLGTRLSFQQTDLNESIPFPNATFEVAISLDVILHLRNRTTLFRDTRRILIPKGKFLFTDAAVLTGLVSADEFRVRASRGYTQFVQPGFNEHALQEAGFDVLDVIDRTPSLLGAAKGRFNARLAHASELKDMEGEANFENEQQYLATVIELSQRRAVSRMTYVAQTGVA